MPRRTVIRRYLAEAISLKHVVGDWCQAMSLTLERESEDALGLELTYQNAVAGIRFEYSPSDQAGWRAVIAELVDGKFPPYPIQITERTQMHRHDLRDLANERRYLVPDLASKLNDGAPLNAAEVLVILTRCASDVMLGNFSVFPSLRARVMRRVVTQSLARSSSAPEA